MKRKMHTAEEIVNKLRQAEVQLSQGQTIAQVSKSLGIIEQTYYRWRKEYGGVKTEQAKRMKDLEKENARLKRLLAEAEIDKSILREAAHPNF
jgi:putative transposase